MYIAHFGLNRPPFKITPDTTLFYSGGERGSVLEALSYVVMSGEGITKVIGEVGAGKTMLCRMLEEKLPADQVETIYIANPSISPENILNVLAFEVGLVQQPVSKLEAMQLLQRWLLEKHAANRYVVVLIEEAQGMPLETLEEIRLLSNLETEQGKLLQIVLFGQPELDAKLNDNAIRQLKERIAHNFYLNPLNRDQIKEYLNFRVRNAGYHGPDLFNEEVTRQIARYSLGLIRRINILADKILLAAYAAGTTQLTASLVRKAAADCQFSKIGAGWFKKSWLFPGVGLLAGVLIGSGLWWALSEDEQTERLSSTPNRPVKVEPERNPRAQPEKPVVPTAAPVKDVMSEIQAVPDSDSLSEEVDKVLNDSAVTEDLSESSPFVKVEAKAETAEQASIVEIAVAQTLKEEPEIQPDSPQSEPENVSPEEPVVVDESNTDDNTSTQRDLLKYRLSATLNWLDEPGSDRYSIQLMTLRRESYANLNEYLKELPNTIELSDIFVYETKIGGESMYGVLYQAFRTRAEAQEKLKNMPPLFEQFEPFLLRTVRGLRTEVARSNS